jgi:hypothetical protein
MDRDKAAVRESIEKSHVLVRQSTFWICGPSNSYHFTAGLFGLVYGSLACKFFPHLYRTPRNFPTVQPVWCRYNTHCVQPLQLRAYCSLQSHDPYLRTRPTKPPLKGMMLHALHARHNASYAGVVYSAWQPDAIEIKCPSNRHHPGVLDLRAAMAIMRKACSDAQTWFSESNGH